MPVMEYNLPSREHQLIMEVEVVDIMGGPEETGEVEQVESMEVMVNLEQMVRVVEAEQYFKADSVLRLSVAMELSFCSFLVIINQLIYTHFSYFFTLL
jgi:hypothetical protein